MIIPAYHCNLLAGLAQINSLSGVQIAKTAPSTDQQSFLRATVSLYQPLAQINDLSNVQLIILYSKRVTVQFYQIIRPFCFCLRFKALLFALVRPLNYDTG